MFQRTVNDSGMLYILWYVSTYGETFIPKTRFHGDLEEVSSGIPPFPGKGEVSYPYCTVQYSTVQYSTVQYSKVKYSTVHYSTVQYSTVQYSTVQYSTVQ